ncbi:hypothetical protein DMN91_007497 [Ooceraea biroi]|uniref:RRM domain-containing protein n=1 Tax=Ooceraea biroi TaxID=2015173 RepID=A0A3L8DL11_OOCBI|nr:uncharacterized protein LOC105287522 [Ooceraea biroi]RLU20883.1 hypothetical protein DMN91_007497 [Ooceraea biroi]
MQSNKSGGSRRANNRRRNREKKEEKYVIARMKDAKSEEFCSYSASNNEDKMGNVEQETLLETENSDNGAECNPKTSLMSPSLRRQLQTHKNVLRLLHEYKLASTQINGQRILSIQPIRWSGPTPGIECEIFVGRIPKTIFEDTLYPLFNTVGEVFQIRLMVDMAELTRGYCFIMYTNPQDAARAIAQLDQYEILPGKKIRVLASVNKCKLYIGPLPWQIESEEVIRVMYASAWDIEYVSIYRFLNHDAAYAIVSFKSHRNAALARRKLRPERLFKCNEVHVEWARIDWNPSNVYEDRGMVNDKGEVQITRKYVQSKKTGSPSSSSMQDDFKHSRKQIGPICPFNNDNGEAKSTLPFTRNSNSTRYATMLNMSATLDDYSLSDSSDNKVITDINDNLEPSDRYRKKKEDTNTESFRNFDIWNSNLVSSLSPTDPGSFEDYESSDKVLTESPSNNWGNKTKYWPPKTSSFGGYQYPNKSGISDYSCSYFNDPFDKTGEQDRPEAVDTAQFQAPPLQDQLAPCYMLLHSPTYLYSNNTVNCSQSLLVNHAHDNELRAPLYSNCDYRLRWGNGRTDTHDSVATDSHGFIVGKRDDCGFQFEGIAAKVENNTGLSSVSNFIPPSYAQSYAPNFTMVNFTPIYTLSNISKNVETTSCYTTFKNMASSDREKRMRPILKQTNNRRL